MNQWGPSDTTRSDGVEVKALTKSKMEGIAAAYGNVAGLAKRAGFEMIMIHGGHGWLLNQFFHPILTSVQMNMVVLWKTDAVLPLMC